MHLLEDRTAQILIVEDEGLIAADIQRKLERLGYPLAAIAESGQEALRCARSTRFDLVLMDIRLKGSMDGIATAQALKTEFETPFVYMTAHSDQGTIARAKVTEPLGYILKPISSGDLLSVVEISLFRNLMERRVRTSEAWLSTTLRSVGDGIIATDTEGEIVFMNRIAEKLTAWSGANASGRQLAEVFGLFEETTGERALNPTSSRLTEECGSYKLVSKGGLITVVDVACFENRAPSNPTAVGGTPAAISPEDELIGSVVVFRDVTTRRETEGRLVQSQRMEAVANMAGGLAHDFNNQLTVILGYAQDLCDQSVGDAKDAALEIRQAASVAASITSQLLMLSRRGSRCFEVLNIDEIVCELQPMISRSLGNTRTLMTDLGSPAAWVRSDRNQLKQVLLNLALNARDAMPDGGVLRIETSTIEIASENPESRLYKPGQYVRLKVADTGQGMDSTTLARVFEPFFTTKKAGFGTGLGLSMTHSIIMQNGGYIRAESELGRGTHFEILIPRIDAFRSGETTFRSPATMSVPRRSTSQNSMATVLLVDDEDAILRLTHRVLEHEGYQLLEAGNAQEAELIAERYEGPIHLLITDVMMPGLTGPELSARLTKSRPGIKTLFLSGYPHDSFDQHASFRDDLNFLAKPFATADLLQRLQMLLGPQPSRLQ